MIISAYKILSNVNPNKHLQTNIHNDCTNLLLIYNSYWMKNIMQ